MIKQKRRRYGVSYYILVEPENDSRRPLSCSLIRQITFPVLSNWQYNWMETAPGYKSSLSARCCAREWLICIGLHSIQVDFTRTNSETGVCFYRYDILELFCRLYNDTRIENADHKRSQVH